MIEFIQKTFLKPYGLALSLVAVLEMICTRKLDTW